MFKYIYYLYSDVKLASRVLWNELLSYYYMVMVLSSFTARNVQRTISPRYNNIHSCFRTKQLLIVTLNTRWPIRTNFIGPMNNS